MNEPILDRAAIGRLLDLIGGDPEDLDELLEDFRSAAPELTAQIGAAADCGDLDALRIAAHTLKSNARDFGALQLSALCEALELECRNGVVPDAPAKAAAIVQAEAAVRLALSDVVAEDFQ